MQRWTTETGKPSVALEILLFNFGVCVFYLGGFCSHSFYYLDIFIPLVTIFFYKLSFYLGTV